MLTDQQDPALATVAGRQLVGGLASDATKGVTRHATVHAAPLSVNDVGFAVLPVLVMVSSEVRPVFQPLTVSVTRQAPGSGSVL